MSEKREPGPPDDEVREDDVPQRDDVEEDDAAGQLQKANWTTSTFKSSRSFEDIPSKAPKDRKGGASKRSGKGSKN